MCIHGKTPTEYTLLFMVLCIKDEIIINIQKYIMKGKKNHELKNPKMKVNEPTIINNDGII